MLYASPRQALFESSLDPKIAACLKSLHRRRTAVERLIRSLELYSKTEAALIPVAAGRANRQSNRQALTH